VGNSIYLLNYVHLFQIIHSCCCPLSALKVVSMISDICIIGTDARAC